MPVASSDGKVYEDFTQYLIGNHEGQYDPDTDVWQAKDEKNLSQPQVAEENNATQGRDHKIFFVRHGETPENETNTIREKNAQLTDKGRQQAETAARQLKSEGVDSLVSSTLPRAKETAHIIAGKLGIVPQFDPRLNTWDMGNLEGQPCSDENNQKIKDAVEKTPNDPLGGAESFNDFKDRSFAGIRDSVLNNQGKKLAILTHSKTEGALKSWEATGQDNPSIDPKVVNAPPDKPGSVEPFTMKADSTIMQSNNTFDERFPKQYENLPYINQAPIDKGMSPPGWWRNESVKKDPELDEYPGQHSLKNWPKDMDYFRGGDETMKPLPSEGFSKMPYNPAGTESQDLMYRPISDNETLADQEWDTFDKAATRVREAVKPGVTGHLSYTERTGKDISNYRGSRKEGMLTRGGEAIATSPMRTVVDPLFSAVQSLVEALRKISNRGHEGPLTDEEIQEIAPKLFDATSAFSTGTPKLPGTAGAFGGRLGPGKVVPRGSPDYSKLRRTEGAGDTLRGKAYPNNFGSDVKAFLDAGMSPKEIAKELGVREYSVRDWMGKNRVKVGQKLEDDVPDWFKEEMKQ